MSPLLSTVILDAERTLAAAGIAQARADAEALAAYALGLRHLASGVYCDLQGPVLARLTELVTRRARREPLCHITGRAMLAGLQLEVGPGVFIPRIQTEPLLPTGREVMRDQANSGVAALCT